MGFERARSGETRVVFWLEIDGFAQGYYSGPTAPTVGAGRVAVPALASVGGTTARVDLIDNLFEILFEPLLGNLFGGLVYTIFTPTAVVVKGIG